MKKKIFSIALLGLLSTLNADVISKNGIAKDSVTGLEWQDEPYTNNNNESPYDGEDKKVGTFEYSKAYCKNLTLGGFNDWRLPNIYELTTLIDNTKQKKPYVVDGFLNSNTYFYTSSTTIDSNIWGVLFAFGHNNNGQDTRGYIRCVRAGQLNFDNLVILKNKGKLKVSQENIDNISPKAETRKKEAEKKKQESQIKTITTRSYNSWKTGHKYENTGETYAPFKYISTEIKCSDGITGTVFNNYARNTLYHFSTNSTNSFKTFDDAANYICGNEL